MESTQKPSIKLKNDLFPVISLFLKWYLCRTTLMKNRKIWVLLEEMEEGKVEDQEKWANLIRARILGEGLKALGALLERPVNQHELVHLFERIEEFVQLYAMGLRT